MALLNFSLSDEKLAEDRKIDLDKFLAENSARPKVTARPVEKVDFRAIRARLSSQYRRTLAYLAK
jgi:hypothetical protein